MTPLNIIENLRGKIRVPVNDGAGPLNGLDYFERSFPTSKLAMEAADKIESMHEAIEAAIVCLESSQGGDFAYRSFVVKKLQAANDLSRKE